MVAVCLGGMGRQAVAQALQVGGFPVGEQLGVPPYWLRRGTVYTCMGYGGSARDELAQQLCGIYPYMHDSGRQELTQEGWDLL